VKKKLKNKSQIETICLIQEKRKTPSLKGPRIFINEDLILEDRVELRKEVQKVRRSSGIKEGSSKG